jgi:predicted nucleotidyltransferase
MPLVDDRGRESEAATGTVERFRALVRERRRQQGRRRREELARLVKAAAGAGVERVVLFGSTARDEAGLASDLDLLIVWDTDLPFLERTAALYRALRPQVAVDLLVYTPEEMEQMADRPIMRQIEREGRVLYEA